jgi:hypothetical protein
MFKVIMYICFLVILVFICTGVIREIKCAVADMIYYDNKCIKSPYDFSLRSIP